MKCKTQVSWSESRPQGKDLFKRDCKPCIGNERNMQRRVKKREKEDPLRKWWGDLQKNEPKRETWYLRMREKKANERVTDVEVVRISEQVSSKGLEERERTAYYGYEVLRDQMSLLGKNDDEIMGERLYQELGERPEAARQ